MKTRLIYAAALGLLAACTPAKTTITVDNDSDLAADGEMVEVRVADVPGLAAMLPNAVLSCGDEVDLPYQVTHDSLLIFRATVGAHSSAVYTISEGTPSAVDTVAWGRLFPERLDDMAWENDRSAYRAYGPALQATGFKGFGYDIWTKCVPHRVIEQRMVDDIVNGISFHVDHGEGMDVYDVGATLGGGTAALIDSTGAIVYPWDFTEYEVLDRGPLRFAVRLQYGDSTKESRLISLDAGSWLNRTEVRYDGDVPEGARIAPGIVVHTPADSAYTFGEGFMGYADPTDNAENGNGIIYVGVVAPEATDFRYMPLDEPEGKAIGHILAESPYSAGSTYTYLWGSGWSKGGIADAEAWNKVLADAAYRLKHPLTVTVK